MRVLDVYARRRKAFTVRETALAASLNAASVVGYVDMQTGLPGCDAIDRPVASLDQGTVRRSGR